MGRLHKFADRDDDAFQSTHPVWDGTAVKLGKKEAQSYFNPPIPCGMGQNTATTAITAQAFQSTHPVWDGTGLANVTWALVSISIHPSRVGWDLSLTNTNPSELLFQSTHPVWDGTCCYLQINAVFLNFNPPIPCGMGPDSEVITIVGGVFQSTHPVWDGTVNNVSCSSIGVFQSTHPVWDGTPASVFQRC